MEAAREERRRRRRRTNGMESTRKWARRVDGQARPSRPKKKMRKIQRRTALPSFAVTILPSRLWKELTYLPNELVHMVMLSNGAVPSVSAAQHCSVGF